MTYQRSKAARLREFRRASQRVRLLEAQLATAIEARNQLLLDNERAPDKATSDEIGAASGLGFGASTARNTLKRLRDRL